MKFSGNILKMRTEFSVPVQYYLPIGKEEIHINPLIGKKINIKYLHRINCINCGVETNKSFHQGYCYSCYISVPQTDTGILHPEKDQSHLGISRDMEWAKKNTLIDHFVYLALTGDIKVGVTRHTQIPERWIDQGAIQAIRFARTPYRQLAGQIEVELKKHISDKTNRLKMLTATESSINLTEKKKHFKSLIPKDLNQYVSLNKKITNIKYPFNNPGIDKFISVTFDNQEFVSGKIAGIKGQYLIFSDGKILNIRKHNGYFIEIEINK